MRSGSNWTSRRTAGGGTRSAQPLGVPVNNTSPGATLAKVDNSEIVSHGLNTRLAVVSFCRTASFTRKLQVEMVEKRKFVRLEHRQPRAERTEATVALALEELHLRQLHVAGAHVVGDTCGKDIVSCKVSGVTVTGDWIARRKTRASSIS